MGTRTVSNAARAAALLDASVTEAHFQRDVVRAAEQFGWHWLHVRKSIGRRDGEAGWQTTTNIAGWVDLLLWHERQQRIIAAELKSQKGNVEPEQMAVLASLAAAGLETFLWRPSDWDTVILTLQGKR